jgi:hypothetical protein
LPPEPPKEKEHGENHAEAFFSPNPSFRIYGSVHTGDLPFHLQFSCQDPSGRSECQEIDSRTGIRRYFKRPAFQSRKLEELIRYPELEDILINSTIPV